jgi:hypothetical protein
LSIGIRRYKMKSRAFSARSASSAIHDVTAQRGFPKAPLWQAEKRHDKQCRASMYQIKVCKDYSSL